MDLERIERERNEGRYMSEQLLALGKKECNGHEE